ALHPGRGPDHVQSRRRYPACLRSGREFFHPEAGDFSVPGGSHAHPQQILVRSGGAAFGSYRGRLESRGSSMDTCELRVLIADDDEDDYVLTRDLLHQIGRQRFRLDWTPSFETALQAIELNQHDVYLFDYHLG